MSAEPASAPTVPWADPWADPAARPQVPGRILVGGRWEPAVPGATEEVRSPYDDRTVGLVALAATG